MNCKPGDLAYIVRSPVPEALGAIVEVVERGRDIDGLPAWHVRVSNRYVITDRRTGRQAYRNMVNTPDAWLRPITGVPLGVDVGDEVPA